MDPTLADALNSESFSNYASNPYSGLVDSSGNPYSSDAAALAAGADQTSLDASNAASSDYGLLNNGYNAAPAITDSSFGTGSTSGSIWGSIATGLSGLVDTIVGSNQLANVGTPASASGARGALGALGFTDPTTGALTGTGKMALIGGAGLVLFLVLRRA
ncbi:MAG TPA: hypothetical protein VNE82_03505 [Candidatus Binataceae bacterium]|nr:hypothetical protein [Candidatus Binataceae bacterium]